MWASRERQKSRKRKLVIATVFALSGSSTVRKNSARDLSDCTAVVDGKEHFSYYLCCRRCRASSVLCIVHLTPWCAHGRQRECDVRPQRHLATLGVSVARHSSAIVGASSSSPADTRPRSTAGMPHCRARSRSSSPGPIRPWIP